MDKIFQFWKEHPRPWTVGCNSPYIVDATGVGFTDSELFHYIEVLELQLFKAIEPEATKAI